ncbi:phosphotransferase [Nonomuraea sp. GTA35]|uniref:phosphotransferase n=1 Tax=Nonomuraea sp. GTA35 TaxID=1676746 RepID=UPI0035C10421
MIDITADLVRALVAEQFPAWAHLPVIPVARQGWDNRTFRLGDRLAVRLPSDDAYVEGVGKEDRCLPLLAGRLPLPVPTPVATGRPGAGYPYPWSVRRWLPGDTVEGAADVDRSALARDLGAFLSALRAVHAEHGPAAGAHSHRRGRHPAVLDGEVEEAPAQAGRRRRRRRVPGRLGGRGGLGLEGGSGVVPR